MADLPQSVEDAILRSLEKDPNRRFSSCSELAVALGCQFLSGPASLPEILPETEVKKMGGRWKTYLYPFSFSRPSHPPGAWPPTPSGECTAPS